MNNKNFTSLQKQLCILKKECCNKDTHFEEVDSWADIDSEGQYYLNQDDGSHTKGNYIRYADGTIEELGDVNIQSDMSITDNTVDAYIKNKNRIILDNIGGNLAVTYDDAELFNVDSNITRVITNLPIGFACIITSGIGAETTIDPNGFTVINLRDDFIVTEKQSVILSRLPNGDFLLRG
jgi:hypothetical protein